MKRWLKRKIPKHPAWRWIVFHILDGRPLSISDIDKEEFVRFVEYAKEADVVDQLGLDDLYDHMEEEENDRVSIVTGKHNPAPCRMLWYFPL